MQTIKSDAQLGPTLENVVFTDKVVKNEPMLFNNDLNNAYDNGGVITTLALDILPRDWLDSDLVIDSRVHMLMPGWYPCIPGWHHDDVPRTRTDGQPNYDDNQRSEHAIFLVNSGIAPTEFALGDADFKDVPLGDTVYAQWHKEVEEQLQTANLTKKKVPNMQWVFFDDRTWHRGVAAVENGWRFFIRASRYYTIQDVNKVYNPRGNPRTNEVRKQVQIYMQAENAGW